MRDGHLMLPDLVRPLLRPTPSGQSLICSECGTVFDNSSSYGINELPPMGDGCDFCWPLEPQDGDR